MRWLLLMMLVGCGDNIPEVPTTVVSVETTCSGADCYWYYEGCGTYYPLVESGTTQLQATTDAKLPLAALVQLQYSGDMFTEREHPHIDYTLEQTELVDVFAAFDYTLRLYRIDATGVAVDVDTTHLSASDGQTLTFTYPQPEVPGTGTVVETHTIATPRLIAVDATGTGPLDSCCSVGRPADLGVVAAALLMIVRRRRRTTR